jgi:hypothetical protein
MLSFPLVKVIRSAVHLRASTGGRGRESAFSSHTVIIKHMEVRFCVLTCIKHVQVISMAANVFCVIFSAVPHYTCFSSISTCYLVFGITMKFNPCVLNLNSGHNGYAYVHCHVHAVPLSHPAWFRFYQNCRIGLMSTKLSQSNPQH